jgi:lipopolysaccharide-induced tumor necrosis factor-alpha factor
MAIPVNCPSCGFEGEAPDEQAGDSVVCPDCRANIPVPDPKAKVRTSERFRDEPPPETKSRRGDVAVRDDDDFDDRPSRRRSRRRKPSMRFGSTCKACGSDAPPVHRSQISPTGWVVFVIMLLFCWPLFFIGLMMKEEYSVCADCGARL